MDVARSSDERGVRLRLTMSATARKQNWSAVDTRQ